MTTSILIFVTLRKLSDAMVSNNLSSLDIEFMIEVDTQENGTCATLVLLFGGKIKDLNVNDLQSSFLNALVLSIKDIIHTKDERKAFKSHLIFTILQILVKHGGQGFEHFQDDLDKAQPETADKIKPYKLQLHPLPAWNIDESSITGNADVIEAIGNELQLDKVPEAVEHVQFLAGDQLSIARLCALELIQAGHETGRNAMFLLRFFLCCYNFCHVFSFV